MGIDPVTHEPLHKDQDDLANKETTISSHSDQPNSNLPQSTTENSSSNSSPTENSSSSSSRNENSSGDDQSTFIESICNVDESLMNSLWVDETPLIDALWNNDQVLPDGGNYIENGMVMQSNWEDNCSWLLDCQDFGVHDFGMDCFIDTELNSLDTLGMEKI